MSENNEEQCPLCLEKMDVTDSALKPCQCGYQMCLWCYNKIYESSNPRCPACRQPYSKLENMKAPNVDLIRAAKEEQTRKKAAKEQEQRDQKDRNRLAVSGSTNGFYTTHPGEKALQTVRVRQRNLVYVVGLPLNLAKEDTLKKKDYFGRFGKIQKIAITRRTQASGQQRPTATAYVTYKKESSAMNAISAMNGLVIDGKMLKATYGTTKYCSFFLRNQQCVNPNCLYLHELAKEADCYTKDDLATSERFGEDPFVDLRNDRVPSHHSPPSPPMSHRHGSSFGSSPPTDFLDGPSLSDYNDQSLSQHSNGSSSHHSSGGSQERHSSTYHYSRDYGSSQNSNSPPDSPRSHNRDIPPDTSRSKHSYHFNSHHSTPHRNGERTSSAQNLKSPNKTNGTYTTLNGSKPQVAQPHHTTLSSHHQASPPTGFDLLSESHSPPHSHHDSSSQPNDNVSGVTPQNGGHKKLRAPASNGPSPQKNGRLEKHGSHQLSEKHPDRKSPPRRSPPGFGSTHNSYSRHPPRSPSNDPSQSPPRPSNLYEEKFREEKIAHPHNGDDSKSNSPPPRPSLVRPSGEIDDELKTGRSDNKSTANAAGSLSLFFDEEVDSSPVPMIDFVEKDTANASSLNFGQLSNLSSTFSLADDRLDDPVKLFATADGSPTKYNFAKAPKSRYTFVDSDSLNASPDLDGTRDRRRFTQSRRSPSTIYGVAASTPPTGRQSLEFGTGGLSRDPLSLGESYGAKPSSTDVRSSSVNSNNPNPLVNTRNIRTPANSSHVNGSLGSSTVIQTQTAATVAATARLRSDDNGLFSLRPNPNPHHRDYNLFGPSSQLQSKQHHPTNPHNTNASATIPPLDSNLDRRMITSTTSPEFSRQPPGTSRYNNRFSTDSINNNRANRQPQFDTAVIKNDSSSSRTQFPQDEFSQYSQSATHNLSRALSPSQENSSSSGSHHRDVPPLDMFEYGDYQPQFNDDMSNTTNIHQYVNSYSSQNHVLSSNRQRFVPQRSRYECTN